jgi:hypothetical protein
MVPLMVVASSAEGPASSGSVPTMAMNTMAMRPTHACLQQQQQQQQQRKLCINNSGCMPKKHKHTFSATHPRVPAARATSAVNQQQQQ